MMGGGGGGRKCLCVPMGGNPGGGDGGTCPHTIWKVEDIISNVPPRFGAGTCMIIH